MAPIADAAPVEGEANVPQRLPVAAPISTGGRVRTTARAVAVAVLGAAPHVLHHAGPLAGAALLAGATGRVLFAVLGLLVAVPMLWRMRRRRGSWRGPAFVLALMVAGFAFSSTVVGPAVTEALTDDSTHQATPAASPQSSGDHTTDENHRRD
jgi:peptidoglycan/LPS O-acetylase OafA/YrhL